ncbi:MAG: DUF885 domain-containing protein [Gammaproteobacteria bacterium]|nr:DUF885 domain-containing protein [Gammaproteobacteria bacterium]
MKIHGSFLSAGCLLVFWALPVAADGAAADRLHALIEHEWERDLADDPLLATYRGDLRYNDRWPDLTAAARTSRRAADARVLAELDDLPRAGLTPADQLNYELFRYEYADRVATAPFAAEAWSITARDGPQALNEVAEQMPFATTADYETWLRRLAALPRYLDQYAELLREAAAAGRTQPRVVMERVLPQLEMQLAAPAEASPFYDRFRDFPQTIPAADRERLRHEARAVIGAAVVPAYRRFQSMFRDEYLPACRAAAGISATPDGAAYYANRVRHFTTTGLTPEQIHALGLAEVARNRAAMLEIMREVGFTGTLSEFFAFLRSDPQFYYGSADELFRAYVYTAKMIEPELPQLFGRLYRTPFGVRPIPATSAPNTTTAYYSGPSLDGTRPGWFYVNLYRPEVRPKYEIEVLTVHEAAPGHHLQIALAQELTGLPKFRRFAGFTAFVEGWALYSERLGYDLGLYRDPWSRLGQLTYDQWRAVRLVVDTGIHHFGWSRQQAIDYFLDNAAKTEADVINEIDRYSTWPGQALAYKIGQLRILALRERAAAALGPRFDLRAFHDALLENGALPLDLLERRIDAWIAERRGP